MAGIELVTIDTKFDNTIGKDIVNYRFGSIESM